MAIQQSFEILEDELLLRDKTIFGSGHEAQARLFATRVFGLSEVRALHLDSPDSSARIQFKLESESRHDFLLRLADAVGTGSDEPDSDPIPHWPPGSILTLKRNGKNDIVIQTHSMESGESAMSISNTSVGLGAAGELLLPVATPLAAGILVATNLNVVRDAGRQLSRGKVGMPVFHTALLACSIATGQVLAFALTDWSLRYWQRRWRRKLNTVTSEMLDESLPTHEQTRLLDDRGEASMLPTEQLTVGQQVRILSGEPIPADGRVVKGEALIDESVLTGQPVASRKQPGDPVWAGTLLVAGYLDIEVKQTGVATRAARIADQMNRTTAMIPHESALRSKAESMADRTVLPSLATAGIGWMTGGLIAVGAILHQDWISGPVLAIPLQTAHHLRQALRQGIVVQSSSALHRMAESDFVIIDADQIDLSGSLPEVAEIDSNHPELDRLLQPIASAGLYLGDERAIALAELCRQRGLIVRRPDSVELATGEIVIPMGQHRLRLVDQANPKRGVRKGWPDLTVWYDETEVAHIRFRSVNDPRAAEAMRRLRQSGLQLFLISSAPEKETARLALQLGIEMHGGDLDTEGKIHFIQGLRKRGIQPIYAAGGSERNRIGKEASVTVAFGGFDQAKPSDDLVLPGSSPLVLAELIELSRNYEKQISEATRKATVPNLLCIAGAFGGVLNGITSGIIANLGVFNVDRRLQKDLKNPSDGKKPVALLPPARSA